MAAFENDYVTFLAGSSRYIYMPETIHIYSEWSEQAVPEVAHAIPRYLVSRLFILLWAQKSKPFQKKKRCKSVYVYVYIRN